MQRGSGKLLHPASKGFKKGTVQGSPSGYKEQGNKRGPDLTGEPHKFHSSPSDTIFRWASEEYGSPSVNLKFKKKIKVI